MRIRQAKISDCNQIKITLENSWIDTYTNKLSDSLIDYIVAKWHDKKNLSDQIKDPNVLFLVSLSNNHDISGLITIKVLNNLELFLGRLYVDSKHQQQGIGKKLLRESIQFFPKHRTIKLEVLVANQNAIEFYYHQGFIKKHLCKKKIQTESIQTLFLTKNINGSKCLK